MNKFYLEYIMKLNGKTYDTFANDIGISKVSLIHKTNGEAEFRLNEIRKIRELFNLSDEELMKIFFEEVVN